MQFVSRGELLINTRKNCERLSRKMYKYFKILTKVIKKVVLVLNSAPRYENGWESGGISPPILTSAAILTGKKPPVSIGQEAG
jgi:hypothetical protein